MEEEISDVSALTQQFHQAMLRLAQLEWERCRIRAPRYLQMVTEKGGLATAKQLLASQDPAMGFTRLWECGCLDITVEALVLKPRHRALFSSQELDAARTRLRELGYDAG